MDFLKLKITYGRLSSVYPEKNTYRVHTCPSLENIITIAKAQSKQESMYFKSKGFQRLREALMQRQREF